MGLKFGQNIKFQFFLRFLHHSGRDKAFLSRQSLLVATKLACRDTGRDILLLVATSVVTYCCLSRHRARHTACRDIGRDILLLVATSVATYCVPRHRSRHTACRDIGRDMLLLVATSVATYCCLSRHRSRHTACRDIGHDILLVATSVATCCCLSRHRSRHTACRDIPSLSRHTFLTASCFFSPTCRGHNFFILTRIWACEYSLESSLNVECTHEGI